MKIRIEVDIDFDTEIRDLSSNELIYPTPASLNYDLRRLRTELNAVLDGFTAIRTSITGFRLFDKTELKP